MHIHSFRVGKSYVEFEKDFLPRIFLIGGYNGSGKSFFLRCLFALLRSYHTPERYENYLNDKEMELLIEDSSGNITHIYFKYGILKINNRISTFKSPNSPLANLQDIIFFMNGCNYFDWMNRGVDLSGLFYVEERNYFRYESLLPIPIQRCKIDSLSTGQLKRESIKEVLTLHQYWSKCHEGIVLMDDLDANLHPDWQYQIIRDLQDWAPQHQYIITTHSYDMCEALTPAHVKEII